MRIHALFRPFGSEGSGAKICSVLSPGDILVHGEIRGGEYHEGTDWGTSNGGSSLCAIVTLAWYSGLCSSIMKVGVAAYVKFRLLSFGIKI
jgi:hypothetical protein